MWPNPPGGANAAIFLKDITMEFETWLQGRLTVHGHPVGINGDWGRVSIAALKAFQKRMGLPETGVADRASVEALRLQPGARVQPLKVDVPAETMPPWMAEMHSRQTNHKDIADGHP